MKSLKLSAIFVSILTLAPLISTNSFAHEGMRLDPIVSDTTSAGVLTTFSPVVALTCWVNHEMIHSRSDFFPDYATCETAIHISANMMATATTVLLLKDVKAAQPDALNYVAGAAPSPLLYSTVEKLQDVAFKATGKLWSFDEIVSDIIGSI